MSELSGSSWDKAIKAIRRRIELEKNLYQSLKNTDRYFECGESLGKQRAYLDCLEVLEMLK